MTRAKMIADLQRLAAERYPDDPNAQRALVSRYLQGFDRFESQRPNYKFESTEHVGATSGLVNELCDLMSVDAMKMEFQKVLNRHFMGDWGNVDAHDRKVNESALKTGARVLSAYNISGVDVWVITDAADENGVRYNTTIMRPSDY